MDRQTSRIVVSGGDPELFWMLERRRGRKVQWMQYMDNYIYK